MNKIKEGIHSILLWLVGTNYGRLLVLFILTPLFTFISDHSSNDTVGTAFMYASFMTAGALLLYILTFIVFAWIVNPIRDLRAAKKNKKK